MKRVLRFVAFTIMLIIVGTFTCVGMHIISVKIFNIDTNNWVYSSLTTVLMYVLLKISIVGK